MNSPEASVGAAACLAAADAEWTNPKRNPFGFGSRQQSWSPSPPVFSLCTLLVLSSSLSFPFEDLFKNFLCCLGFCFFCFFIMVPAKPTKELAITSVVRNLLPTFQYTHLLTHPHTHLLKASPFSSSNQNKPKKIKNAHIDFHISLPFSREGLEMFEICPQSASFLEDKTWARLGISNSEASDYRCGSLLRDLVLTSRRFWTHASRPVCGSVLRRVLLSDEMQQRWKPHWAGDSV